MKAPGKAFINHPDLGNDPQPATMNKYVQMPDTEEGDWGGVHYNSGIANFAFYVAAFNIGGNSWEKTIRVVGQLSELGETTDFSGEISDG